MDNPEDKNTNQETINAGDKDINVFPSDEKLETTGNNPKKINKYVVIAVIVIILLLILAYVLYHFNILGVRALIRNTLGLNHKTTTTITNSSNSTSLNSSANSALISAVKSYFPSLNTLTLSAAAVNANNLNNNGILHYSVFGEGAIINPFQNGVFPQNYSGILMLFMVQKNNETLGDYYKNVTNPTKIYNTSFKGTPAFVEILNITSISNASVSSSQGALNLSSYHCSSGLNLTFKNNMNETVSVKNITLFNESGSYGNGSTFSASGAAMPGNSLTIKFPNEICNSSNYEVIVSGYTNYSISNLSRFVSLIKFSKYVNKTIPQEIVTALGVSNSKLYEVSILAGGNNYLSQINSSLNKLLENLSIADFS